MLTLSRSIDEQFRYESNPKITRTDLRKLKDSYALAMEEFLKEKGLFEEFYARKILANITLSIDSEDLCLKNYS